MFPWKGLLAVIAIGSAAFLVSQTDGKDVSNKLIGDWKVLDESGAPIFDAGSGPTLSFQPGQRLVGFSGCNRMMGYWSVSSDILSISHLPTTRMNCDAGVVALEERVGESLTAVQGFSVTQDRVQLRDSSGTVLLVLKNNLS